MINVVISKDTIEISGHSGYAERGYDIVCASVSTASQMTINQIELLGLLGNIYYEIGDDGYLKLQVVKQNELLQKVVDNLRFTLIDMSEQFSDFIKMKRI
jgi:uncharacterized protein YsxB (DUF464 family)